MERVYCGGVKRYYTILEAALTEGVPERKVYNLLREGKVIGFKRGGHWIIPRDEVGKIREYIGCKRGVRNGD